MYNGEIISYTIGKRPVLQHVMDMLDIAFAKIPDNTNLIFHRIKDGNISIRNIKEA